MTINWVEQTNKQTNKQIAPGQRCRVLLARHMAQSPDQLRDSTLIYDKIFFVLFHAESSVSQGSLTQGSSVLSPFDPFLAIDRSYTTCFRSKKVRNSTNVNIPLKRKETAEEVWSKVPWAPDYNTGGLNHSLLLSFESRLKHYICVSSMNNNGWIVAWCDGRGVSAVLPTRFGFLSLCYC